MNGSGCPAVRKNFTTEDTEEHREDHARIPSKNREWDALTGYGKIDS